MAFDIQRILQSKREFRQGLAKLPILYAKGEREAEIQRAHRIFPESEIMPMGEY